MRAVFKRARGNNVKFNSSKVQLKASEVLYMGHIVSDAGLSPSRESEGDRDHAASIWQTDIAPFPEHCQVSGDVYPQGIEQYSTSTCSVE